jgi:hypothetical protein
VLSFSRRSAKPSKKEKDGLEKASPKALACVW